MLADDRPGRRSSPEVALDGEGSMKKSRGRVVVLSLVVAAAAACAGGGGGSGGGPPEYDEDGLAPPAALTLATAGGQVRVDWTPVAGADSYYLYWSATPGVDPAATPAGQSMPVSAPPALVSGLQGDFHVVVTSVDADGQGDPSPEASTTVGLVSPYRYFPAWGYATPTSLLTLDHDDGQTQEQNGTALANMLHSLLPGDRLEIGTGTYEFTNALRLSLRGTAQDPIWIAAKPGAMPVLTRDGNSQNGVEFGNGGRAEYVIVEGIEIRGGDVGLRLYDCRNLWFDRCEIHLTANNAIAANSNDTELITFTRNEVHHTSGYGEGFYVGANDGAVAARFWVIALNEVHHCGGSQGDGIEVKQGSYGNWIAENLVYDTNYPCILVYGTSGEQPNLIEKNVLLRSANETLQVQGDAIVRNNVVIDGSTAFYSGDHQGPVNNLVVVHNTFLNDGPAVTLNQWSGKSGMVFANNACYSQTGIALRFGNGSAGVQVSGNVAFGSVLGTNGGYTLGGGLSDFQNVSWDGSKRNVTPTAFGALIAAADAARAELEDQTGHLRMPPYETGAVEEP